jgi:type I restriction enzyme S subunit
LTTEQENIDEGKAEEEVQAWKKKELDEVADINLGQSPKGEYYNEEGEGPHFIQGSKNFGNKYPELERFCSQPKRQADEGDVLISVRAPVGPVNIAPEKLCIGRGVTGLKLKEGSNDFLYYFLKYFENRWSQYADGTTFNSITKSDLQNLEIPYPPLKERNAIAYVLNRIDEKIETNNKINENLGDMAQTLFKSWFVDFERYNEFKESDIGEIPVEFEVCTFGEISDNYDSDRDPVSKTKRNEIEGDIPYYGATKVLDFMDDYLFDGKFLLIAEDGSVKTDEGYPVIQFINKKFWASNHVHVVQGKGKVSTEFLRWAMSFVKIKPYITGSVQPKLNQTNLNSIELAVPPEENVEQFTDLVKPLHDRIWQNKKENDYLERLRDTLLPKLMSGEVRVNDIELDELEVDSEV